MSVKHKQFGCLFLSISSKTVLRCFQRESAFLSNEDKKQQLPAILAEILENLNERGTCSIYISKSISRVSQNTTHFPRMLTVYCCHVMSESSFIWTSLTNEDIGVSQFVPMQE